MLEKRPRQIRFHSGTRNHSFRRVCESCHSTLHTGAEQTKKGGRGFWSGALMLDTMITPVTPCRCMYDTLFGALDFIG